MIASREHRARELATCVVVTLSTVTDARQQLLAAGSIVAATSAAAGLPRDERDRLGEYFSDLWPAGWERCSHYEAEESRALATGIVEGLLRLSGDPALMFGAALLALGAVRRAAGAAPEIVEAEGQAWDQAVTRALGEQRIANGGAVS